jgi:hypothetical protein
LSGVYLIFAGEINGEWENRDEGRGVVEEQSGGYSMITSSVGTYTEVLHSAGQRLAADYGGH